ncbi:MAG: arginine--tRNA ligase [Candidatus Komeilibacteria bacterium]
MSKTVKSILADRIAKIAKKSKLSPGELPDFVVNYPSDNKFGHYATNICMVAAKLWQEKPMVIATELAKLLSADKAVQSICSKVEVASPGFVNFYLKKEFLVKAIKDINKAGHYGQLDIGKKNKVQIEFISANPTGPLTLANGRGGFIGDTLANVLSASGYKVEREYLVNDAGNQIVKLGQSLLSAVGLIEDSDDYYHGDYIQEWAATHKTELETSIDNPERVGKLAADELLNKKIKPVITDGMKIKFDRWYSEDKELRHSQAVDKIINELIKRGVTYEKDGALWLHSTADGDDKDRVLRTADGRYTYLAIDAAYHADKFQRGFDKVINIWGADHGGYVARMQSIVKALGHDGELDIILMQLVKLVRAGEEVRMSKRKGDYVSMQFLLDLLPLDVIRWFFIAYAASTHMLFDLDAATDSSEKNPVYYVQYAHARICSVLRQASDVQEKKSGAVTDREAKFMPVLLRWPELLAEVASSYQVNQLTTYAIELADNYHRLYQDLRVIDNGVVDETRLALMRAYKKVLAEVLATMGISVPDKM